MSSSVRFFRYLTHPQVLIDPEAPVPEWRLSDLGRSRAEALAGSEWLRGTKHVIASAETKAAQTAAILASSLSTDVEVRVAMHENDRSATGFLEPKEFEAAADQFFAHPTKSVRGWETAVRAQVRIVTAVEEVLSGVRGDGNLLFVGHGAVGTLLYCHYARFAISRKHDQPAGGGNYFTVRIEDRKVLHSWLPMEQAPIVG
jgi:broad specificity phosphatase PhoE